MKIWVCTSKMPITVTIQTLRILDQIEKSHWNSVKNEVIFPEFPSYYLKEDTIIIKGYNYDWFCVPSK